MVARSWIPRIETDYGPATWSFILRCGRRQSSIAFVTVARAVRDRCSRSLAREPAAPVITREAPADLDSGREARLKSCQRETDIADELRFARHLDSPEAIAVRGESSVDAICECVGFRAIEPTWEMLHDDWVGIQPRKRIPVGSSPAALTRARAAWSRTLRGYRPPKGS